MSEFSDQKARSARRNRGRHPNQPTPTTIARSTSDPYPMATELIVPIIVENQAEAAIGAAPSSNPGISSSSTQEIISLGRLISVSSVPASDSIDLFLVLEASSSRSPRLGSIFGVMRHTSLSLGAPIDKKRGYLPFVEKPIGKVGDGSGSRDAEYVGHLHRDSRLRRNAGRRRSPGPDRLRNLCRRRRLAVAACAAGQNAEADRVGDNDSGYRRDRRHTRFHDRVGRNPGRLLAGRQRRPLPVSIPAEGRLAGAA